MTLPSLLLGLVIALLAGAFYHTVRGGGGWRLLLYLGCSSAGFALAVWLGMLLQLIFFKVGALDIGIGLVGSLLLLALSDWLSSTKPGNKSGV